MWCRSHRTARDLSYVDKNVAEQDLDSALSYIVTIRVAERDLARPLPRQSL
jgi:hypothetical protein